MRSQLQNCCIRIPQRWIFAFMCFLALFNAYAMRSCLSITITEMVPKPKEKPSKLDNTCPNIEFNAPAVKYNVTETHQPVTKLRKYYSWDQYEQGIILSSFYWGYVVTHIPGGMIAEKYGGKHTLGIGILITAILTILTPLAVEWGEYYALIAVRIFMGLGEGITYPAINVLLAQWTPPEERSRTGSFVYAGALIGTIFATSASGWILQYYVGEWPLVFYVIGGTSVIWFLIWLITCYNNPKEHPFISMEEINYLNEKMAEHTHEQTGEVPWSHILTSMPVMAVILALIGFNWSILTIVTDLPKYFSGVLKFPVEINGYITSLVFFCMWFGGTISSWVADYLITKKIMSITKVRKLLSISALTISGLFIVAASFAGCDRVLVVSMFVIAMTLLGTAFPSVMINALDLSPNFAGTLMALTNGSSAFTGIFSPYIIGILTTNETLDEWRLVFLILLAMSVSTNIVFLIWGSGEVEYWNNPNFSSKRNTANKIKNQESSDV